MWTSNVDKAQNCQQNTTHIQHTHNHTSKITMANEVWSSDKLGSIACTLMHMMSTIALNLFSVWRFISWQLAHSMVLIIFLPDMNNEIVLFFVFVVGPKTKLSLLALFCWNSALASYLSSTPPHLIFFSFFGNKCKRYICTYPFQIDKSVPTGCAVIDFNLSNRWLCSTFSLFMFYGGECVLVYNIFSLYVLNQL